ncbi:hypothetical protein MUO32_05115 [Shinella sp. CPCC 101442]|uniref:hypothetical protein n=1 Tax=Shinella sp. CPCC 101442 TaxID=2932265 RepID=UPI0021526C61|nr:hypothetical protein [Shinella sp. CPCC 101442]MCR6498407.1 hypothetical protein [Shinella sp. CPCC 101442]
MSFHSRMMLQRYGLGHTTSLYSQVVFDPIFTPIFAGTVLGNITIAGISAATIASAIATTALSIGLQYLLAPKPPKPDDGKQPVTQAIPYRQWVVGRRRVAGAFMLWEAKGSKLYAVQAIAGHRINAITKRWLHDDVVTIDGGGNVQPLADGRYGYDLIALDHRIGLPTETAYAPIVADLSADAVWTSNHRGDGQASLSLIAKTPKAKEFTTKFPYGAPRYSVEVEGAKVWDPRDPAQSPSSPSTWTYSRNAALIMLWHQCFSEFGHRRDYTRAILPVIDMWKEEADVCDEDVALNGGGTEKRYLCDGFATAENDPKVGTNAILATCDGWLCERGDGALLFVVGKFREKYCGVLKDRDITGYQLQHDVLFKDECNRLIPKITHPLTDYTTTDTDFFEDTAAQLVAGRILAQEADYGWCTQWRQGRRLGIRDWRRFKEKKKGALDVRLSGINAVYKRWNRMETPMGLPSLDGAVVENRRSVLALTKGGFTMDFVKHPVDIDAWNPATDEGSAPPVPPKPAIANIPTPDIDSIVAKAKSGGVYLALSIVDPDHNDLSLSVRYRIKDTGAGSPGEWVEQIFNDASPSAGFIKVNSAPVPPDYLLEVESAYITSKGKYGNWSPVSEIFSTADPVAPQALDTFTQTASAPHLGNAVFSFKTKNDPRVKTVDIYRVATGASFNPALLTPVFTQVAVASTTYGWTDGDTTRVNALANGNFAADTDWSKGPGWSIAAHKATHATGNAGTLSQSLSPAPGDDVGSFWRWSVTISGMTANILVPRLTGGTTVGGPSLSTNGTFRGSLTSVSGNNAFALAAGAPWDGSVDDAVLYKSSVTCAPQGVWDYYAVPRNGSGVPGPTSGPITVTII